MQQIDIILKDEYNNEIDFNGIDWGASLVITEYLSGETIRPLGNFDEIYLHRRKILLEKDKMNEKEDSNRGP